MKAAVFEKFGEPTEVLKEAEVPTPKPSKNQVLIKTIYGAVHNHNVSLIRGEYGYKPQLPCIGGTEGCGVIVELGSNVKGLKVGTRVSCSQSASGTWADYFIANAGTCLPLPDSVPDEAAAQLIGMPLSALMLLDDLNVKSGDWTAYNCANGVVGKMMAAICKQRGTNMLKIVRREEAKKELEELGFSDIVVTDSKSWRKEVSDITKGAKITSGVDNIGGWGAQQVISLLSDDGRLVLFGNLTKQPIQIQSGELIFTHRKVEGYWAGIEVNKLGRDTLAGYYKEIIDYVSNGSMVLNAGGIFNYKDAKKAMEAQLSVKTGKILFSPASKAKM